MLVDCGRLFIMLFENLQLPCFITVSRSQEPYEGEGDYISGEEYENLYRCHGVI